MHFLSVTYFWLAAAVLLLAVLYFWRRHSRRLKVPALFLWDVKEEQPNAGRSLRITRLPLSFFLEALAVLLLAVAAAMPFLMRKSEYPPLAVVLDNSFSMLAFEQKSSHAKESLSKDVVREAGRALGVERNTLSVKELCIKDLAREVGRYPGRKVFWVLAGSTPQKLEGEQSEVLEQWTCNSISSDIPSALQMARQLCVGGEILVLTDRPPAEKGVRDVRWIAHGKPLANISFVNARRSGANVLLEIYNASSSEAKFSLGVAEGIDGDWGVAPPIALQPNEIKKIDWKLENPDKIARFLLEPHPRNKEGDAIAFDNTAVLLPESRPPLAYRIADGLSEAQENLLRKTLMRNAEYVSIGERELVFCGPSAQAGSFHRLIWHGGGKAVSSAPITVRPDCPRLLQGLSFADVLWPADASLDLPGTVLLYQGDVKLLSVVQRGAFMDMHLNLHETAGNLAKSALWPSFFWNLSDYLRSLRHAPDRVNVRCGDMVTVPNPSKSRIVADGEEVKSSYPQAYVIFDEPGVHRINDWQIAVNPFDKAESDLSGASSCDIRPDAASNPIAQSVRRQIAFAFMLLAAAVLALHWHISRGRR